MIHRFQPSITATKDEAVKPPRGFRFGNFEGVRALPSVGTAHVAGQHVKSYFNNKQIFNTICEWFETWMPWQRRIIFCGTTDRCSIQQLEYLATALEPVFHRDFATARIGHYPRGPLKKKKKDTCHMALVRALRMATEGTDLDRRYRLGAKRKQLTKKQRIKQMQLFAVKYVQNILEVSLQQYLDEENALKSMSYDELHGEDENNNTFAQGGQHWIVDFRENNSFAVISCCNGADSLEPSAVQNDSLTDCYQEETSQDNEYVDGDELSRTSNHENNTESKLDHDSEQQAKLDCNETRISSVSVDVNQRPFSSEQSISVPFNHKPQSTDLSEQVYSITPTQCRLPPLEAKKASTLSWCMNRQLSASLPSTPVSGTSARLPHRHCSNVSSVDITSASEFFQRRKASRLGSMHGALRTGHIKKPNELQDLYIPLQKSYKNAKWWNSNKASENNKRRTTRKPARAELKEHFKQQVKQVWQWLSEWEDHEKSDLLVELIKLCDQDLLKFFAQCLVQRLEDRNDINSLPDKLLFYIFTYLPPEDIGMAEKVCRRWHYITAQDELWRIKCEELGAIEHIPHLVNMVEDYMKDKAVDWREAYEELSNIALNARFADQGRRQGKGWLRGPSRQCHLLNINFDDLLKRTPIPIESIHHIPIVESSSSSEESIDPFRRMSTVVDVPLHFIQTAYDDTEDSGMSSRTTDAEGITPDMQNYRRNSLQISRNEGEQTSTPTREKTIKKERAPKPRKNKAAKAGHEDFALDIRPDPVQAKDLLPDKTLEKNETEGLDESMSKRDVVVKPVKRVRRLQGHLDAVFCLMFDARRIVTGSMDRTIRVWDIRSGRSIRKIYGHKGGIRCIQFDEDKIISGSWDTTIMVWDIIHFNRLAVLAGHNDVVSCLKFNNKYLVTGSYDKTIRVWSLFADYQCVHIIESHTEEVTCLVLDGVHVTSGSADCTIKVSNILTGECVLNIDGLTEPVTALALQGELILSGTLGGKLFFWNRDTGEPEAGVQPHDTPIFNITFLPQSLGGARFLTAAGDGTIKEWDLFSMTCVRALHGHRGPVRDVQATADRVVSCSDDGNVRIWDLYTPCLRAGTKAAEDTIDTTTINQRKEK